MTDTNTNKSEPKQQFEIQRIYLKGLSFETTDTPKVFVQEWKPTTNVDINCTPSSLDTDSHEVVLKVTVTTKLGDKAAYLVEVEQAGIFSLKGFKEEEQRYMLRTICPTILFPYASELIASTINRGTFPSLFLQPINFEALYQQQLQQAKDETKH